MSDGLSIILLGQAVDNLKAEVSRLTAELAARTEERDELAKDRRADGVDLGRLRVDLRARTEERGTAIKALCNIADALFPDSPMESRYAEVDLDAMGACQIIRRMREERDELAAALAFAVECARAAGYTGTLREPPVALAAVKARAKAEGLREAAETFSLESQPFKLWHPHDVADELDRMAAQGEGKSPA